MNVYEKDPANIIGELKVISKGSQTVSSAMSPARINVSVSTSYTENVHIATGHSRKNVVSEPLQDITSLIQPG